MAVEADELSLLRSVTNFCEAFFCFEDSEAQTKGKHFASAI